MITTIQIKKIGTGYFILLPVTLRTAMELEEGDFVLVDVIKKVSVNDKVKKYNCTVCKHEFATDDDVPYCPICDELGNVEVVRK